MELLPFIPPIYHDFYRQLNHEESISRQSRRNLQTEVSQEEYMASDDEKYSQNILLSEIF